MFFKNITSRYTKKTITVVLIIAMIVSYGVYRKLRSSPPPQDIKVVEVEYAQRKNIQQTADFIGTIKSEQATMLIAKSGGILNRIVNAAQHVKKGDVIAKIENNNVDHNYSLSHEMEQIAKLQYDRYNQLYKTGVTSKSILEEKKSNWMEYQKKMSDAKIAMDDNNIYAPFDGIVGIFKIHEGSQVRIGDALVTLYDPSSTIVEFDVPLSVIAHVQDGNTVFVNNKQYPLTSIQRMLDEDTHMSPAYVRIECEHCIIGSNVDVTLVTKQKNAVIVIPYEAVFLSNGKTYVYTVHDNKAALTPIELGLRNKAAVEVISGLKPNDAVIIRGQARLYPGAAVKIASPIKNTAK
jgi:membrane fusion protein (multidrug efflux system)